jgi:YVTN family beta-propeller protein
MYATIPSQNSVAIINTNTLAASTVFVGSGPANLAFSPDGSKAYIANSTSNFVVVFDTQTRTVTNSFQLPEEPQDVVFGSLNRLWVLGQSQIFQIDATTGASTGPSITNSIYSGSLEISPDRNTLYYADYGLSPGTMYKYDVSGTTPVLVLQTPFGTVGSNGEDLTLSHNGSFICYATGSGQNGYQIAKFRTSDFATLGSFNTGPYPHAVAFSPDDLVVYASVDTASGLKVFDANTFLLLGTMSGPDVASKLAVESTGRYLFAGYTAYYSNFMGTLVFDTGRNVAPGPPAAHPATYVASNSFTANWSSVGGATGYRLDVATDSSFTTYVTGYQNLSVGNATSRSVTGLNPSTLYYYRVRAYNGIGTSGNSNTISVTTLTPTGAPVVRTNPATNIASYSATINGSLDPHGLTTTVYFQYGTTISYGLTTAPQSQAGSTYRNISANISGLTASTRYHFRIVATNSAGTTYGADQVFTTLSATGPPVVTTTPATNVTSSSVTLNGVVDPHGLTTSVYFQYGTTTTYGLTTAAQSYTGSAYLNISAYISGLTTHTTYHFRIVATNSAGTTYGRDRAFSTF